MRIISLATALILVGTSAFAESLDVLSCKGSKVEVWATDSSSEFLRKKKSLSGEQCNFVIGIMSASALQSHIVDVTELGYKKFFVMKNYTNVVEIKN